LDVLWSNPVPSCNGDVHLTDYRLTRELQPTKKIENVIPDSSDTQAGDGKDFAPGVGCGGHRKLN